MAGSNFRFFRKNGGSINNRSCYGRPMSQCSSMPSCTWCYNQCLPNNECIDQKKNKPGSVYGQGPGGKTWNIYNQARSRGKRTNYLGNVAWELFQHGLPCWEDGEDPCGCICGRSGNYLCFEMWNQLHPDGCIDPLP